MKKIVLCAFAVALTAAANAQTAEKTDTARFMRECRQFDEYVAKTPFSKPVADSLTVCQDTLTDREYGNSDGAATLILLVLGVTALITLGLAIGRWIGLRKSQKLSRSVDNHRLAKERQVKNG